MNIDIEPQGRGIAVIRPAGNLDLQTACDLKQWLVRTAEDGANRLIVDLDRVPMLDSSGLAALITGLKAARQAGGDLRLARPSAQARYVLQLAGLDRVLLWSASIEEAVARIGERHREMLVLSADKRELQRVRGALARLSVAAQMARPGAETIVRTAFSTAVIEIASEVLAHAGPPGVPGALAVELALHNEEVEALLEDSGQSADDADASATNGHSALGMSAFDLAARSVDSLEFERLASNGKRWRLRKRLQPVEGEQQPVEGRITIAMPMPWAQPLAPTPESESLAAVA